MNSPAILDPGRCERLLALHLNAAVQRLGAAALSVIDLPPLSEGPLEPAQIRVGAVLYWCMAIERGGLLEVVETLGRAFRAGDLPLTAARTVELLHAFQQSRDERYTVHERQALYRRVFDPIFEEAFGRLVEALYELARHVQGSDLHLRVRIGVVGDEVARIVSSRCVGMAGFAAREILTDLRAAWAVLQDRELQGLVGAASGWDVVRRIGPSLGQPLLSPEQATSRAGAGREILGWLADVAPSLVAGSAAPPPAVLEAATRWRLSRS